MLRSRIIPVLLIKGSSLVKTIKFKKYSYIGDPCNTVRIFNELEVDPGVYPSPPLGYDFNPIISLIESFTTFSNG